MLFVYSGYSNVQNQYPNQSFKSYSHFDGTICLSTYYIPLSKQQTTNAMTNPSSQGQIKPDRFVFYAVAFDRRLLSKRYSCKRFFCFDLQKFSLVLGQLTPPAGQTWWFTLRVSSKGHVLSLKSRPGAFRSKLVRDNREILIVIFWPIPMHRSVVRMGNGSMGIRANSKLTELL